MIPDGVDGPLSLYDFAYHVPNGIYLPGSPRVAAIVMRKMKEQGLKPGVPDVVIPVRTNHGHPGAYLELKFGKVKTSAEQKRWHALLRSQGYYCEVTHGIQQTMELICMLYG